MRLQRRLFRRGGGPALHVRIWHPGVAAEYALLLVHGTAGHGGCYDDFARAAAARGAVVYAPDLRGHGRSDGSRGVFTMQGFLDDVDAVAEFASREGLVVVALGSSQGGEIAFHALAASRYVDAAVCMNILLASELPMNRRMRLIQSRAVGLLASILGNRVKIPLRRVIDFDAAYAEDPHLLAAKRRDRLYVWSYGLASYRSVFTYTPPQPAAGNIKPVLVAVGEDDPIISAEHCRACFARIGGPKHLAVLPRAGHQLLQFHRERFVALVDDWIRRNAIRGVDEGWSAALPNGHAAYNRFLAAEAGRDGTSEPGYTLSRTQRLLCRVRNGRIADGVEFFRQAKSSAFGRFVSRVVAQIDEGAWPAFAPFLPSRPGTMAVLGAGDGAGLRALLAAEPRLRSWAIDAIDIDPETADTMQVDARDLGHLRPSHYDAIYCHGILDHCSGHREVLASCAAALRPGGVLLVIGPDRNPVTWLRFVAVGPRYVFGLGRHADLHDFRRFGQPAELDALARSVGLHPAPDPEQPSRAFHRGIDYVASPLGIYRAVRRRDLDALRFRITRPRWWLGGGYPGEYLSVYRRG